MNLNINICQPCTEEPAKTFIIVSRHITESFWFEFDEEDGELLHVSVK